jgi:hypothetical protein
MTPLLRPGRDQLSAHDDHALHEGWETPNLVLCSRAPLSFQHHSVQVQMQTQVYR